MQHHRSGRKLAIKEWNQVILESGDPEVQVVVLSPVCTHHHRGRRFDNQRVKVGSQNCASEPKGAYTGEVSAEMVKSTGAEYVILGHSERREYYGETSLT